jgi:Ca2+/Na+ antiporter
MEVLMLFQILMYLQILLMIAGPGANATYAIWIQRGMANRDTLPFALHGIKFIDDRVARAAYGLLLLTGLVMYLSADESQSPWTLLSLILWLIVFLLGLFGYSPTLRKQIALAEGIGADSEEYKAVAWRGTFIGILAGLIVLVIIYLMVFQPALWS